MASHALKNTLIRHVGTRNFAAQAAPAVAAKECKVQNSVTPNKTMVAALDSCSPVTRVTVAYKAGSRFESQPELGLAHALRSAAGMTTGKASTFIIARKLAQVGAAVTASGDREFIYYTLETTANNLDPAMECLVNLISKQEFRQWELSDNVPRLKYELAGITPQVRAVDLLHKAAYRVGLGNSLFMAPKKIGKVSTESLLHYATNNIAPQCCAVAIVGDNVERATMIAQSLEVFCGTNTKGPASKYYGGELRKEMGGPLAHVAIALPGAPAGSAQSVALAIAAKALGNGPVTKWGSDLSPLAKAIGNIGPYAAAGFNVSYSDHGLYGVVLSVPRDEAGKAAKSVAQLLKCGKLPPAALSAGRAQLKVQLLSESDDATSLSESLAAQSLYTGSAMTPAQLASVVDQISDAMVLQTLASSICHPFSMGSVGDLVTVPYVDELLC